MQQVEKWAIVKIENCDDFPSIFQTAVVQYLPYVTSARIYRPSFRENKPKTLVCTH
jgi:hypothetical protein